MKSNTVIVFAPHPDDDVLGVGGTIIKRVNEGKKVVICIATVPDDKNRKKELKEAAKVMGVEDVVFLGLPDMYLYRVNRNKMIKKIVKVIEKYKPEEVYTPHRGDLHTDHRILTEAVIVATRPKYSFTPRIVYAYETLSETGWNYLDIHNSFNPNVYEDISETLDRKCEALMKHESQVYEYPSCRSIEAVRGLAVYRGTQAEMNYAEAFEVVRWYKR